MKYTRLVKAEVVNTFDYMDLFRIREESGFDVNPIHLPNKMYLMKDETGFFWHDTNGRWPLIMNGETLPTFASQEEAMNALLEYLYGG